jgi:hypothetical protein
VSSVIKDFDFLTRGHGRNTEEDQEQSWLKKRHKEPAR